jgi:hypothetical protein
MAITAINVARSSRAVADGITAITAMVAAAITVTTGAVNSRRDINNGFMISEFRDFELCKKAKAK